MLSVQHPAQHHALQNLLHHLNSVFWDVPATPRKPVISLSKVLKGEATLSTKKHILGWDVDTQRMEIQLPDHHVQRLTDLLDFFLSKHHASKKQWQRLLGELRSMALAIHSSRYLFSNLQHQLVKATARCFRISALTRHALDDWRELITSLNKTPVPIVMLAPHAPHYWAVVDASAAGMGGSGCPLPYSPIGNLVTGVSPSPTP